MGINVFILDLLNLIFADCWRLVKGTEGYSGERLNNLLLVSKRFGAYGPLLLAPAEGLVGLFRHSFLNVL